MSIESSKGFPRTVGGKVRFPRCQDVIELLLKYWGGNEIEFGWGRGKYEIKNDPCSQAGVIFMIRLYWRKPISLLPKHVLQLRVQDR